MLRIFLLIVFLMSCNTFFAKEITTLKGLATNYVGKELTVYSIDDYLSGVKTKIAQTSVQDDATFKVSFYNNEIQKLYIEVGKNNFSLYAQPKTTYNLQVGDESPYSDAVTKGIEVEFYFLDLDSTDINYKILVFEDFQLNFLENYYNQKTIKTPEFVARLDTFKFQVEERYKSDTSSFFKTYVKFSIASLDNLSFLGQRNEYEKYDFYLKHETVWYQNDRYMDYIKHYYNQYEAQLSNEVEDAFYKGVIKSSPTLVMNALSGDYALKNLRLRELITIKMCSEIFYSGKYPQTNILTILDSISNHALFQENKIIADNIKFRLLDLKPGTKMPDFSLSINGAKKYKSDLSGKHVYFQFIDKASATSLEDLKLLHPIQQKYSKHIGFVTIVVADKDDSVFENPSEFIREHNIAWDVSFVQRNDDVLKRLGVSVFPYYLLMDATGYVVQAPALSPRPNNEYETIENHLFKIMRHYQRMENEDH